MQVSATLIAAQQAAREARIRLQVPQAPQETSKANFAAALEKTSGFSALPLRQTAAQPAAAPATQAQTAAPARMGMHIDITI